MGLSKIIPLQVRVDLEIMAMKGYSTLPRSPELEPHHQMHFIVIPRIPQFGRGAPGDGVRES